MERTITNKLICKFEEIQTASSKSVLFLNFSFVLYYVRTSLCLVGHTYCSCYTTSSNNPDHQQYYEHNVHKILLLAQIHALWYV